MKDDRDFPRNPEWSDDEFAQRKLLHENGGRLVLDVAALPIDDVRDLLGKMGLSIHDVLDGPDQVATHMPDGTQPRTAMDDYIDADIEQLRDLVPTRRRPTGHIEDKPTDDEKGDA